MKLPLFLSLFCLPALYLPAGYAQTTIPFDSPRWTIKGNEVVRETYQGLPCLKLTNGTAVLKEAHFTNGIIEYKMFLEPARYFPGIGFRMADSENGEIYYLRPHQSGNPDAMQYYPEYHGSGGWQLYYGKGFGNAHKLPFDRWLRIKILVSGSRAEVYFDEEKEPVLYIRQLKRAVAAGMIALDNSWPVAVRYADVSFTPMDSVALLNPPDPEPPLPASVFSSWQVSAPFDEARLPAGPLSSKDTASLSWQTLGVDDRGVADLSILAGAKPGKNTVFVRQVLESNRPQVKRLSFGFSDRVHVYLNGKLLYTGQDNFLSRDYRFLGTMGYFDALYLDLRKGRNELWMALSEDMGGWGVQAKLEDMP
jgi:hypothetical protein